MYSSMNRTGRITVMLALATMLSWLGEAVHNAVELPGLTILSLENSIPGVVAALLFGVYLLSPFKRASVGLLLGWGLLNLVGGGIISVLPLNFLPFSPAQTLTHYLAHLFYSAAEIPLILITARLLREPNPNHDLKVGTLKVYAALPNLWGSSGVPSVPEWRDHPLSMYSAGFGGS